jgi:hypothetical protein
MLSAGPRASSTARANAKRRLTRSRGFVASSAIVTSRADICAKPVVTSMREVASEIPQRAWYRKLQSHGYLLTFRRDWHSLERRSGSVEQPTKADDFEEDL